MPSTRHGFTLIELSIVLVIIGLITAGVLVGRELITQAQLRKQVAQVEEMKTAVNTFRTKYSCLPGDCIRATELGLGASGNGDGIVRSGGSTAGAPGYAMILAPRWATNHNGELINFWYHMQQASLLNSSNLTGFVAPFTDMSDYFPAMTLKKNGYILAFTYGNRINVFALNGYMTAGSAQKGFIFNAVEAHAIDTKMDDGLPATGIVVIQQEMTDAITFSASEAGCTTPTVPGPVVYDIRAQWYKPAPFTPVGDPNADLSRIECALGFLNAF